MPYRNSYATCNFGPESRIETYIKGKPGRWVRGFFFPPNMSNMTNFPQPKKPTVNSLARFGISADIEPPDSFDWREKVELSPILDQGLCGSCFAMAVASSMTDRIIVAQYKTNSPITGIIINPLQLLACVPNNNNNDNNGCNGGIARSVAEFAVDGGGTDQTSKPFWSDWCQQNCCGSQQTSCTSMDPRSLTNQINNQIPNCSNYSNYVRYKVNKDSIKNLFEEPLNPADIIKKIKQDIFTYGPVVSSYMVFEDFQNGSVPTVHSGNDTNLLWPETNGVYIYNGTAREAGGHSVTIVGWGSQRVNGYGPTPYWIVKNSWGDAWGDKGYFKMAMYDADRNINVATALDVPVTKPGYFPFGGGLSFQMILTDIPNIKLQNLKKCCYPESGTCTMAVSCDDPNYEVSDCNQCKKRENFWLSHQKLIIYILSGILIFLLIGIIVQLFRKK